jgi:uncharacterized protein YndB with AHSA1/START domain
MAERTRGYAHRIDVQAPVELVWRGLIEPEFMNLWLGSGARVRARAGGSYFVNFDRDLEREAHIDVFEPARRLRLIYQPPRGLPAHEAVVVDDFILAIEKEVAVLRLLGSGFPQDESWDPFYQRLRDGWARALARLKVCIERRAQGKDQKPGRQPPKVKVS